MTEQNAPLYELLQQPQRIVVTAHTNPDGDAIGSSLALFYFLQTYGHHQLTAMLPSAIPNTLLFLPGQETILICNNQTAEACQAAVADASLIFVLDCNDPKRLDAIGKWVVESTAVKVMIDHHLEPNFAVDYSGGMYRPVRRRSWFTISLPKANCPLPISCRRTCCCVCMRALPPIRGGLSTTRAHAPCKW